MKSLIGVSMCLLLACSTGPVELPSPTETPVPSPQAPDAGTPVSSGDPSVTTPAVPAPAPDPGTHTDGIKNAGETDVDCGGDAHAPCTLGKGCAKHSDCVTDACTYDGRCTDDRSCTSHFGGDTCGEGETGQPGAKHVSCCERAPLFGDLANVKMDRFLVTAGRMRTFVERLNGDVRGYVKTLPHELWHGDWDTALVPSNIAEADEQLGSFFSKKSCHPGDYTGRTYWTPGDPNTDFSDFTKDQLNEKALNCVTWQLVAAFCAWDGGRMATSAEIKNAFTEDGKYVQPWMWQPGATQYVQPVEYVNNTPATSTFNHAFGYNYPKPLYRAPNFDIAYHISPPGRYPQSWNEHGHEIAGNLLEWNATGESVFSATYSWENHGGDTVGDSNWKVFQQDPDQPHAPNGYYAIGGRCSR